MTEQSASDVPPPSTGPAVPAWLPGLAAAVLLAAFLSFEVTLLVTADASDSVWQRRLYVLGSLEAIVFTAVGWMFGREVQRGRVKDAKDAAKESADLADRRADEVAIASARAASAELTGEHLSTAIRSLAARSGLAPPRLGIIDVGTGYEPPDAGLDPAQALVVLDDLAQQLYPVLERDGRRAAR